MDEKPVTTPLTEEAVKNLKAGDRVLITGILYTARDAAHKRLSGMIQRGEQLPFDLKDQIIYYVGPSPAKPGRVIGSAGPTTSGRMDIYTPKLLELGLRGMIGKGQRNQAVLDSIKRTCSVYFAALGGAGALLARTIKKSEVIAFADLGTEAIHKLTVVDFPAVVVIDREGRDLYRIGREAYRR